MDIAEVHQEQHQEKAEDTALMSSTIEKPSLLTPSTIQVESPLDNAVPEQIPHAPSETTQSEGQGDENASRKNTKRRSGNSVDLTYRYREPSDDELSWTEDEHGTRRRRKSKKAGKSDDFKNGIVPVEGKKRRKRRRSGADEDDEDVYSYDEESEEESEVSTGGKRHRRRKSTGKTDDFKTGIVPREGKSRKKKRKSTNGNDVDGDHEAEESDAGHQENDAGIGEISTEATSSLQQAVQTLNPKPSLPELGDGWTNVEWTILEHTHDHLRPLSSAPPESMDPTALATEFLKIYATSELKLKAEEEGKQRKQFSLEEVRDRIIALRQTKKRRESGELPPAKILASPSGSVKSTQSQKENRRLSGLGLLKMAKFW